MQETLWATLLLALMLVPVPARADLSAEDISDSFTTATVLDGLNNPWGLAIRAGRNPAGPHELLVAESGAGRVIRVSTDRPSDVQIAVDGFPVQALESFPDVRVGPLGLTFLTRTKLVVTGPRGVDDKREIRAYALPGDNSPVAYDAPDHSVGPVRSGGLSKAAEGDLLSVAADDTVAFITLRGGSSEGRILKSVIAKNRLETLRSFVSHTETNPLGPPAGITLTPSPRPRFLVVADRHGVDDSGNSRLTFYTLESGSLALRLQTGLSDITGLAYSPSGQLYAVDCDWNNRGQGGVYRLVDARHEGRQVCRAVKIASVSRGISLVFDPGGALYVTALGEGENKNNGKLLKISGDF